MTVPETDSVDRLMVEAADQHRQAERHAALEVDAHLKENGVSFLPWIGDDYDHGFMGRKLLVLGESHYCTWGERTHNLRPTITRKCVQEVLNREKGAPLWPNIEQALLNEERTGGWAPSGGACFWHRLAFYNFVQFAVRDSNTSPTRRQFKDSWHPFKAVIEALRPERVLVCGKRLWSEMEPTPYESTLHDDVYLRDDVQGYCLNDGTPIWCLVIRHPSRGFSWRRWHSVVIAFLKDPSAAALLPSAWKSAKSVSRSRLLSVHQAHSAESAKLEKAERRPPLADSDTGSEAETFRGRRVDS